MRCGQVCRRRQSGEAAKCRPAGSRRGARRHRTDGVSVVEINFGGRPADAGGVHRIHEQGRRPSLLFAPHPPLTPALSPQLESTRLRHLDNAAVRIDQYLPQHAGRESAEQRQRAAQETAHAVILSALGAAAGRAFLAGSNSTTPADLDLATGTCRSVSLSVGQSVSRSVSHPVSESASQPVSQPHRARRVRTPHARSARIRHARCARSDAPSVRTQSCSRRSVRARQGHSVRSQSVCPHCMHPYAGTRSVVLQSTGAGATVRSPRARVVCA